ncbi:MAG TPA: hypothetical protein VJN88_16530 [Ktedonobacterales bacterium]|nr:hypothetical protein [Ktedonobacterales bacterium]
MGNRANYVLIEGEQPTIYFSRWGALTIPAVLLSGPDATISYVRSLTPDDELLDEVWAEGGMVLDVDQCKLKFFGGGRIEVTPYLRRPLLRALSIVWAGWTVEWALFGVAELALSVGWDVGRVLDSERDDRLLLRWAGPDAMDKVVQVAQDPKQASSIITIRRSDEHVYDHLLVTPSVSALSFGPRLLDFLDDRPSATLPSEDDPDLPREGAYLDVTAHTLWMWECSSCNPRYMEAIRRRWPSWQVHAHTEGLVRQVELSGRDASAVMVSDEQGINQLVEELMSERTTDPPAIHAALIRRVPLVLPNEGPITFGKGFFSADGPQLSPEERREVLLRLLHITLDDENSAQRRE